MYTLTYTKYYTEAEKYVKTYFSIDNFCLK